MLELSRHTPPSLPVPFKSDKTAALPSRILTDRAASVRAGSKSLFEYSDANETRGPCCLLRPAKSLGSSEGNT